MATAHAASLHRGSFSGDKYGINPSPVFTWATRFASPSPVQCAAGNAAPCSAGSCHAGLCGEEDLVPAAGRAELGPVHTHTRTASSTSGSTLRSSSALSTRRESKTKGKKKKRKRNKGKETASPSVLKAKFLSPNIGRVPAGQRLGGAFGARQRLRRTLRHLRGSLRAAARTQCRVGQVTARSEKRKSRGMIHRSALPHLRSHAACTFPAWLGH